MITWSIKIEQAGILFRSRGRDRVLFQDLNLSLQNSDRIAVLGKSGCGKSSLLSAVAGLTEVSSGSIARSGEPRFGFVFQSDTYLPWRTVGGNLSFAATQQTVSVVADLEFEKRRLLSGLGLDPEAILGRRIGSLSGGERRRVCLAMALISRPDVLILDEANSGLDEGTRFSVCDFLLEELDHLGAALITVTHDLEEAILTANRFLLLRANDYLFEINPLAFPRRSSDRYRSEAQTIRADLAAKLYI